MKKYSLLFILLSAVFFSCEKEKDKASPYMVTGIKASKGNEMVTIDIDTGNVENSVPVEYYVVGSTFFDNVSGCYGFVNSDTVLKLVDPLTGLQQKSIKLPGFISFAVIDETAHELIGLYTESGKGYLAVNDTTPGPGGSFNTFVVRVDLSQGNIISQKKINIDEGLVVSVYYYDEIRKKLVVYRGDQYLISIDPQTGSVNEEIRLGKNLFNSAYNKSDNTLIGLVYSPSNNSYTLEVLNASTGKTVSSNIINNEEAFCLNVSGYNSETGIYYTVNGNYEILLYQASSGEIIKRLKLEDPMNDIKFWKQIQ